MRALLLAGFMIALAGLGLLALLVATCSGWDIDREGPGGPPG